SYGKPLTFNWHAGCSRQLRAIGSQASSKSFGHHARTQPLAQVKRHGSILSVDGDLRVRQALGEGCSRGESAQCFRRTPTERFAGIRDRSELRLAVALPTATDGAFLKDTPPMMNHCRNNQMTYSSKLTANPRSFLTAVRSVPLLFLLGSSGLFLAIPLQATAAPANDSFANGVVANAPPASATGSNVGATKESGE